MNVEQANKLRELILKFEPEVKEIVDLIEGEPHLTMHHYDRYMTAISRLANDNHNLGFVIGMAMIKAGANKQGVQSALRILYA